MVPHGRSPLPAIACCLALVLSAEVGAQSPAGGELLANRSATRWDQLPFDLACGDAGVCMVVWDSLEPDAGDFLAGLGATSFPAAGGSSRDRILGPGDSPGFINVVPVGSRFALFWSVPAEPLSSVMVPVFQLFDRTLAPRSVLEVWGQPSDEVVTLASAAISLGFAHLSSILKTDPPAPERTTLSFVDHDGQPLRPEVAVNSTVEGTHRGNWNGLTVDPASKIITAVFDEYPGRDFNASDVFYRRFSQLGEALGPQVRVNTQVAGRQSWPVVASAPNGDFIVAWTSHGQDGSGEGVFAQRFTSDGASFGPEFQVNREALSDQIVARIAIDAHGNFVIVWQTLDPGSPGRLAWDVKARLYRAAGAPVGPEIFLNRRRQDSQDSPLVAFARNGVFVAAWHSIGQLPPSFENHGEVVVRRFSASVGDEPCIAGSGTFSCDTGRTGGSFEVTHNFGGGGAGPALLGDVDGDGREDPCDYTGGVFRCDTDHEGGAAEVRIAFSISGGGTPLLADMDGDGRADPCLARAGRFACDTAHNGGSGELNLTFGQAGETPLVGDVNGDGRAEACGFAAGFFRCDTAHNGVGAELIVAFGKKKDIPLLGDYDGDGRDDFCVFRKKSLLCDTAHNGGAAEASLKLDGAAGRPLLGNLDGL